MFAAFSSQLWSLALGQGFQLDYWLGATGGPSLDEINSDAAYLAFQKVDIATLICLHVVDTTRRDWREVLVRDASHKKWAEGLLDRLQNVAIIYVLVGDGPPPWGGGRPDGFEDYYGQQAYSVFWWLDLNSGAVTVSKGQPSQLFGLRGLIEKARADAQEIIETEGPFIGSPYDAATIGGVPSSKIAEGAPVHYKKRAVTTAEPVRRVPFITFFLVGVNAVVLVLMYMAGYPADIWVPARFGAIVPTRIFEYGEWYRLFTAMFVHFGAAHFFANVMGLVVFGTRVERYFGRVALCVSYVFAGLLGSLFSLYFTRGYAAGASGAIYGLIGVIFVYTRMMKRSIEHMNWYTLFLFIGVGIAMGLMTPGVDNFGHLGGLVGGLIVGAVMVGFARLKDSRM